MCRASEPGELSSAEPRGACGAQLTRLPGGPRAQSPAPRDDSPFLMAALLLPTPPAKGDGVEAKSTIVLPHLRGVTWLPEFGSLQLKILQD